MCVCVCVCVCVSQIVFRKVSMQSSIVKALNTFFAVYFQKALKNIRSVSMRKCDRTQALTTSGTIDTLLLMCAELE